MSVAPGRGMQTSARQQAQAYLRTTAEDNAAQADFQKFENCRIILLSDLTVVTSDIVCRSRIRLDS